jgi:opacity protein-like surface antigen
MQYLSKHVIAGALLLAVAGFSHSAVAADLTPPPPEAPSVPEIVPPSTGGWYLRGDIGYSWPKFRKATYGTPGCEGCGGSEPGTNVLHGDLKGSFLAGGGVGYQFTDYFRADVTADYMTRSKFEGHTYGTGCDDVACASDERAKFSALSILANAYVDLGNFNGITPYIGAGIGGTRVKWSDLDDVRHGKSQDGAANWRFTYAVMAGASIDLTSNLKLDAGYRFRHINGGKMFEGDEWIGDGRDKGMNVHDVRVGLRYQFGGSSAGYAPEPLPAYK